MNQEIFKVVWTLPCMSQEFEQGPQLTFGRATLEVQYDYEQENGKYEWSKIRFDGVHAFSFTTAPCCTPDQVKAYDKLVEVTDSEWNRELVLRMAAPRPTLKHYRIYFDEVGSYEVLAVSFHTEMMPRIDS